MAATAGTVAGLTVTDLRLTQYRLQRVWIKPHGVMTGTDGVELELADGITMEN